MAMDGRAEQFFAAMRTWVETYSDVLALVWERFAASGEWPEAARLTRERFGIQPRRDFTEIAGNMPPQLGRLDIGGAGPHRIVLMPRGLSYVPGARPVLDAFARLVQIGVERFGDIEGGDAVIGAAEFQGLLELNEQTARQLEELVVQDRWFFRLGGGNPVSGDLRIVVDERAVFSVAEVQTIDDYLDAQVRAWYPEPAPAADQEPVRAEPVTESDPRRVMVVHGRDTRARNDLFILLRALGLSPIEWSVADGATGTGTPYTGEAVEAAFALAQAAVVLFPPEERVLLREDLRDPRDPTEALPAWQARPNVYFEGGIAFTSHPDQTIVLELGPVRVASDLLGRNVTDRQRPQMAPRVRRTSEKRRLPSGHRRQRLAGDRRVLAA